MISLQNQAVNSALTGDWKEAVMLNKNLIKNNPQDVDALSRLAFAFSILGKAKEARLTYQKVLKIDPLNSIALRNIKRIPTSSLNGGNGTYKLSNIFLEEPGKTKIVELLNIAPSEVINNLQTGQMLALSVKRLKVFVLVGKQYVGMLPDDIGKRLIKFIEGGNTYEVYTKSASGKIVIVFIKETKRVLRFKDQPSFIYGVESALTLDKQTKKAKANMKSKIDEEEDEDPDYSEEVEA
ncbi:MAG: tetratricopeptide repeat protein [Candidatus Levyibacteriota bacterium]